MLYIFLDLLTKYKLSVVTRMPIDLGHLETFKGLPIQKQNVPEIHITSIGAVSHPVPSCGENKMEEPWKQGKGYRMFVGNPVLNHS